MYALAMQAAQDGLTLREIIADIPHDFAALLVYIMIGVFVFLIWYGSRPSTAERWDDSAAEGERGAGRQPAP